MIIRAFIILVLVGVIFGGAAYFAYELYWKPQKLDREDREAAAQAVATPTPDRGLPAFEEAMALRHQGKIAEAGQAFAAFIERYPQSSKLPEARAALGQINLEALLSPSGASLYTVAAGDSLVKIAGRHKTSAELIYRVNNLETIMLSIGQQLAVPQIDTRLVINRAGKTLTLFNKGQFVKEYPLVSLKTPGLGASNPVETKVADKIALNGSTRVAFGEKNYSGSDRWIMLGASGLVIRAAPEIPDAKASPPTLPPGILVSPPDIDELFLLVSRGTPVRIE